MRLTGIQAVRYGALEGASLEGLGEGLTVVLGPNEAGKTTYTTLVRHVLYGFPTQREKDRHYFAGSGKRVAWSSRTARGSGRSSVSKARGAGRSP